MKSIQAINVLMWLKPAEERSKLLRGLKVWTKTKARQGLQRGRTHHLLILFKFDSFANLILNRKLSSNPNPKLMLNILTSSIAKKIHCKFDDLMNRKECSFASLHSILLNSKSPWHLFNVRIINLCLNQISCKVT